MEKAVRHRKRAEDFWEKGLLFHSKPSTLFREHSNRNWSNILNDGNTTNAVKHRMHGIHFSTTKRLVRKRFVS